MVCLTLFNQTYIKKMVGLGVPGETFFLGNPLISGLIKFVMFPVEVEL